jgi:hypothetical protein
MYKYNNGNGAVICNKCRILIDVNLSHGEYLENYGISGEDVCWRCIEMMNKEKVKNDNTKCKIDIYK